MSGPLISDCIAGVALFAANNTKDDAAALRVAAFARKWSATLDMLDTVDPGDIVAAVVELCGRVKR